MAGTETARRPGAIFGATTNNEVVIIDAGVPNARTMQDALSTNLAGSRMDCALPINPFDPNFHEMLDALEPAVCGDRRSPFSVA